MTATTDATASVSASAPASAPATAGTAPAPATLDVLLDDGVLRIEHHRHAVRTETVVVAFDPLLVSPPERPYAVDFLLKAGVDVISVRKHAEHFYQPLSRDGFDALLGPTLAHYRRRLAYGSSLGAYAVLYYCRDGYDHVVASSPRVSAHPRHGVPDWQGLAAFQHEAFDPDHPAGSDATVFYDPHDPQDRHFIDDELRLGWPGANWVRVPYAGHPANQFLAEIGFIAPFVRALVRGAEPPRLDRRLKRRSGMYHHVLAEACLRHGKPHWAQALATRALQLSPRLLLARRTLGSVALALGRLDEAESHLRAFAERYPRDGIAHTGLQRLAQQRRDGIPVALPTSVPSSVPSSVPTSVPPGLPTPVPPGLPAEASATASQAAPAAPAPRPPGLPLRLAARLWRAVRGTPVSRDDVCWAYRSFLGREPESEAAIAHHLLRLSLRSIVQSILDSDEYRHRLQQVRPHAAAPAPARSSPYADGVSSGPVVLVALNCIAPGVAAALAAGWQVREAMPVVAGTVSDEALHAQLAPHAHRADLWFTTPGNRVAQDLFAAQSRPGVRLFRLPLLQFNAFHPDVCSVRNRRTQRLSTLPYNSAIAVWGYANGLTVDATAALFQRRSYEALGYLRAWPAAVEALQQAFADSDLAPDFGAWLQNVQRSGCFMHTPDHPRADAVAHLAQLAAQQAGLPALASPVPGELADGLNGVIWPVYPEIAQELGLGAGSLTWKFVSQHRYLHGVEAFVAHSFETWRAEGMAPGDIEPHFIRGQRLDGVMRELTGRTPP